jgi:amino acid transporter
MATETEQHGLHRELRLRDLVPMQILMVVGITWAGMAAKQGSAHGTMWLFGVLFFFLPQAAVVTWCARRWPYEGGVYQWAKLGIGPFAGFMSAWNFALYVIIGNGSIGISSVTSLAYALGPRAAWMANSHAVTLGVAFVLLGLMLAVNIPGFKIGRWVSHFGTTIMLLVTALLLALLVWHPHATAAHPHVSPQRPFAFGIPIFTLLTLNLFIKVAFNCFSGLEQVAVFAGETKNAARAVLLSAWIAAPAIVVIYVLMASSILTYVPSAQVDLAGPIPQVIAAAFGSGRGTAAAHGVGFDFGLVLGGVTILALAAAQVAQFAVIVAESSRLPMVAGWDSLLPQWFTRLHPRYGTPVRSLIAITLASLVAVVLATVGTGREEAYQLLVVSGNLSFGLYYAVMFLVPLLVGSKHGDPPNLWIKVSAVCGLTVTTLALVLDLAPIVDVTSTWAFALKVGLTALATNAVGAAIYLRGRRTAV